MGAGLRRPLIDISSIVCRASGSRPSSFDGAGNYSELDASAKVRRPKRRIIRVPDERRSF